MERKASRVEPGAGALPPGGVQELVQRESTGEAVDWREVVAALAASEDRIMRPVSLWSLIEASAELNNVTVSEMLSQSRHKDLVRARSMAATAAKIATTASYPEIAKAMRRGSHSGTITRVRTTIERMQVDPVLAQGVQGIIELARKRSSYV